MFFSGSVSLRRLGLLYLPGYTTENPKGLESSATPLREPEILQVDSFGLF
jgi:hypothetical protein